MLTEKLQKLVEDLSVKLKARGWKLVTAESCTGGGLGFWLTSIPGSSEWFDRGYITYSNNAKIEMLGISFHLLERYGAVSEQVVVEMAENALAQSSVHASIAITGIAGPDGGTSEKPVGYTWIAVAGSGLKTHSECHVFPGDRAWIREQAIFRAIHQLFLMI
ncbi:MAG: hypothetical protein BGO43_05395 [Gammaproteobacteria bacterium 39-13]|nr:MAG: hypothetical protein BGO43_05395 [Gammaproteobacteria bacterium 39-13]